jgi:hypothetical protein
MTSIRVKDVGGTPFVKPGAESPFKQGEFFVYDVPDDLAKYWNKQSPGRREELAKQSQKERKDLRDLLDGFVHKPAHVK